MNLPPLITAILQNDIPLEEMTKLLQIYKSQINTIINYKNSPQIKSLYKNTKNYIILHTPLSLSIILKNLPLTHLLLENQADPNQKDLTGTTILHLAIHLNDASTVELLLRYITCVNSENKNGQTPLCQAIFQNNYEITKLLLSHKDIISTINYQKTTSKMPLFIAINNNNEEIVKLLLSHKIDVNIPNLKNKTPLKKTIKKGNLNIINILLEHNAEIYQGNPNALFTSLYFKVPPEANRIEIIKNILKHDTNKEKQNCGQRLLVTHEDNIMRVILQLLIRHNKLDSYDINMDDNLMSYALSHNKYESAKYLLEMGAIVESCNLDIFLYGLQLATHLYPSEGLTMFKNHFENIKINIHKSTAH
jgi:ankyrin repeat protein